MLKILVCDDDFRILSEIKEGLRAIPWQVDLQTTTTLSGLQHYARTGDNWNAILLDGFLNEGTTTPFIEELVEGRYPHLKNCLFILMSGDERFASKQANLLFLGVPKTNEEIAAEEEDKQKMLQRIPERHRHDFDYTVQKTKYVPGWSHARWKKSEVVGKIKELANT